MAQAQTVNFTANMSLDNMIAAGKFDYSRLKFLFTQQNFPVDGAQALSMPQLHDFSKPINSSVAVGELGRLGLRAATFAELLLFGANNTEEEELPALVALDDRRVFRYDGIRYVPLLDIRKRRLSAEAWIDVGGTHFRFAVVPI